MIVLGIDPGYDRVGVSVMEWSNGMETLHYSTCIETDRNAEFVDRLHAVGSAVTEIIKEYSADTLAIETLFFNKNVKTAINVAEARGAVLYIAKSLGCTVYEFSPQSIKIAITGHGKSDKTAVIDMVQRLIKGAPVAALDDEYDAIAIGVTCLAHHGRGR